MVWSNTRLPRCYHRRNYNLLQVVVDSRLRACHRKYAGHDQFTVIRTNHYQACEKRGWNINETHHNHSHFHNKVIHLHLHTTEHRLLQAHHYHQTNIAKLLSSMLNNARLTWTTNIPRTKPCLNSVMQNLNFGAKTSAIGLPRNNPGTTNANHYTEVRTATPLDYETRPAHATTNREDDFPEATGTKTTFNKTKPDANHGEIVSTMTKNHVADFHGATGHTTTTRDLDNEHRAGIVHTTMIRDLHGAIGRKTTTRDLDNEHHVATAHTMMNPVAYLEGIVPTTMTSVDYHEGTVRTTATNLGGDDQEETALTTTRTVTNLLHDDHGVTMTIDTFLAATAPIPTLQRNGTNTIAHLLAIIHTDRNRAGDNGKKTKWNVAHFHAMYHTTA